ncbi:MAG: hypothetical protein ACQGVC_20585 [Myxococcota bacterium]
MNGWKLCGLLSALLLLAFGTIVATQGTDADGIAALTRITARIAFLMFLPVYVASPAHRIWRSDATRWLVRNRRYLGVAFFVAFALHLDAIWMTSLLHGDAFRIEVVTLVGGGLAYVFAFAMALTSSDRMVRRLGPRRWKTLHRVGVHYIAAIWFFQYLGLSFQSLAFLPLLLLSVAGFAVRIAGRRQRRTSGAPATA